MDLSIHRRVRLFRSGSDGTVNSEEDSSNLSVESWMADNDEENDEQDFAIDLSIRRSPMRYPEEENYVKDEFRNESDHCTRICCASRSRSPSPLTSPLNSQPPCPYPLDVPHSFLRYYPDDVSLPAPTASPSPRSSEDLYQNFQQRKQLPDLVPIINLSTSPPLSTYPCVSPPFSCDYCTKGFFKRESYMAHRRSHVHGKPYACDFCDRSFLRCESLLVHKRIHTGGFTQLKRIRTDLITQANDPFVLRWGLRREVTFTTDV
ncbi:unnamed protein product [Cyprideis torosa]|uniref:Uncharacterized protein n=1 Tax=Cyprideis torosa TaxID=163714 RepID=A0A7R8W9U6_9CRUS|nr:unnamed protein product [Cyprideis torosa]CAG0890147.1 unnamed protein product [Cyprideis torosa]